MKMCRTWIFVVLLLYCIMPLSYPKCENTQIPELLDGLKPTPTAPVKNKKMMKVIEQAFMNFMGLKGKPHRKAKDRVHVPDHMWKLYYNWTNANEQQRTRDEADTARLLHNENEDEPGKLSFDIKTVPIDERVHRAELLLFTEAKRRLRPHKHLRLYKTKFNGDRLLAYYKRIRSERQGYVKIDITDLIKDWKVNGIENSTMIVDIDRNSNNDNSVHTRKRRNIGEEEWLRKQPLLFIYTVNERNKPKKSRTRRNIPPDIYLKPNTRLLNETHHKVKRETCRLRPYLLDFKDFGWDEWIIAPNFYDMNFCAGACPIPLAPHFNTTNHAVIQNAVLGINKTLVPPLCCVPTSFKDQTFLFLDGTGKLLLKTPVEMIALGCGCH